MGHARALLAVANPARQAALARLIAEKGLTVRDAERLAQAEGKPAKTPAKRDPNVVSLERDLSERWGAPVRIRHGKRGGRLEVRYKTPKRAAVPPRPPPLTGSLALQMRRVRLSAMERFGCQVELAPWPCCMMRASIR